MKTFSVNKSQRGYWGSTVLKTFTVKASNLEEARNKVSARKDDMKRLRNGDYISYEVLVGDE